LVKRVRKPLAEGVACRAYEMYAAYHDHLVHCMGSALPIINPNNEPNKRERHYVIRTHGHNAAPLGVASQEVAKCMKWMQKEQGEW